jgi:hypothetical protein
MNNFFVTVIKVILARTPATPLLFRVTGWESWDQDEDFFSGCEDFRPLSAPCFDFYLTNLSTKE